MYIRQEDIYDRTNGGLEIIQYYYPNSQGMENTRKGFKLRETEKTASAHLKKMSDGHWVVTDFGDDSTPRNGIQVCMKEENLCFADAIQVLGARYGIVGEENAEDKRKRVTFVDTDPDQDASWYDVEKKDFSEEELKILGPFVKAEHCHELGWSSLKSFSVVRKNKVVRTESADRYPIFMLDRGEFKKIYQPFAQKQYRFQYLGKRSGKDYIFGLDELKKRFDLHNNDTEIDETTGDLKTSTFEKLPEAVLCSGDRDALNCLSMGYPPLWLNSETAKLAYSSHRKIMTYVKVLYNIPDIDSTGIKQGDELAKRFTDVRTIWLPSWLRKMRDRRGNPKKDLRDYMDHLKRDGMEKGQHYKEFGKLFKLALPLEFWQKVVATKKNGDVESKYVIKPTRLLNFLNRYGYYSIENKLVREGYSYIHINGNIVEEIDLKKIQSFVFHYANEQGADEDLRDKLISGNSLSSGTMERLETRELDFTDYDMNSQLLFFKDKIWRISKQGIDEIKDFDRYVWKQEIVPHSPKIKDAPFEISGNNTEGFSIDIKNQDSMFFRYLINSSRVHWQKEFEKSWRPEQYEEKEAYRKANRFNIAGARLSADEIEEQKQHLINKIYVFGYLLFRYKDKSRPWAVWATDNKISETGESHGGSGKSFAFGALGNFMRKFVIKGRDPRVTENQFIYDGVTKHTDLIIVDDANQYLDFNFFFTEMTNELKVNPKNSTPFTIDFEDSPKFVFPSNFMPRNLDPSAARRMIFAAWSDYYHNNQDGSYEREWKPVDDFGKNLMGSDYTEAEWEADINFFARCLEFYLQGHEKISPPMSNMELRELRASMSEAFFDWALIYFAPNGGHRDKMIPKQEAIKAFQDFYPKAKGWSPQKITKSFKAYAKHEGFVLNPKEICNSSGRIIKTIDGKSVEMLYIQTDVSIHPQEVDDSVELNGAPGVINKEVF